MFDYCFLDGNSVCCGPVQGDNWVCASCGGSFVRSCTYLYDGPAVGSRGPIRLVAVREDCRRIFGDVVVVPHKWADDNASDGCSGFIDSDSDEDTTSEVLLSKESAVSALNGRGSEGFDIDLGYVPNTWPVVASTVVHVAQPIIPVSSRVESVVKEVVCCKAHCEAAASLPSPENECVKAHRRVSVSKVLFNCEDKTSMAVTSKSFLSGVTFPESCVIDDDMKLRAQGPDLEPQALDFLNPFSVNLEPIADVVSQVNDKLSAMPSLDDISGMIDERINIMGDKLSSSLQLGKLFSSTAKEVGVIIIVLIALDRYMLLAEEQSMTGLRIAVAGASAILGVKYIGRFVNQTTAQSLDGLNASVLRFIMQGLSVYTLCRLPSPKLMEGLIYRVSNFRRFNDGIGDALEWALHVLDQICITFKTSVLGYSYSDIVSGLDEDLTLWCKSVEDIVAEQQQGLLSINKTNADRVFKLAADGRKFTLNEYKATKIAAIRLALTTYMDIVRKMVISFERANVYSAGPRLEPYIILLRGKTGVGKSWLTVPFILEMLKKVLPEDDKSLLQTSYKNYIYSRQQEHEYWDGYTGQFVTVFDDYGQVRDVVGRPESEHMDIIRCGNLFPNILHMANLDSKGSINFCSRIIVCTTNMMNFQINSLTEPEAVKRRFDLIVDICISPEYAIVPEANPRERKLRGDIKEFVKDIYEVHVCDSNDSWTNCLSFDEFVAAASLGYWRKEQKGEQYMKFVDSVVSGDMCTLDGLLEPADVCSCSDADSFGVTPTMHNELHVLLVTHKFDVSTVQWLHMLVTRFRPLWNQLEIEQFRRLVPASEKLLLNKRDICDRLVWLGHNDVNCFFEAKKTLWDPRNWKLWESNVLAEYPNLVNLLSIVTALGLVGGLCVGALKCYSMYSGVKPESPNDTGKSKSNHRDRRSLRRYTKPQMAGDTNASEIQQKIVDRNLYSMRHGHEPAKIIGYMFVVKGRFAIFPRHYVDLIDDEVERGRFTIEDDMLLVGLAGKIRYNIKYAVFSDSLVTDKSEGLDICGLMLPNYVHSHPDMIKSFITQSDLDKPLDLRVMVTCVRENAVHVSYAAAELCRDKAVGADDGNSWTISQALKYNCGTRSGDCGCVVILINKSIGPGKIIGMHVAGHNRGLHGMGVAAVLSRECVTELYAELSCDDTPSVEDDMGLIKPHACVPFDGSFVGVGTVAKRIPRASKTKILQSELFEAWGPACCKPAFLKPMTLDGVLKDPMLIAVSKYGGNVRGIDEAIFKACTASYFNVLLKIRKEQNRAFKTFSFEDAVVGVPGVAFCDAIPRSTSSGFPYVMNPHNGYRGKEWYFGKGVEYDLDNENAKHLQAEVTEIIELAKKGKRSLHVFVDILKDERRPIEKVDLCKTRLVSAAPVSLVIATRMLFLDFSMFMMNNAIVSGSAVGMNVYSLQWSELASYLQEQGSEVFAGDFTNFDGSHMPQALKIIGDSIIQFMGGDASLRTARRVLWVEIYNSIHVNGDLIYQWIKGLPSGHPLTTIVNTIMVQVLMRVAWVHTSGWGLCGLEDFENHVNVIAYGDDNVVNVSKECSVFYNQESIAECLLNYGITYTDEMKMGVSSQLRTLAEVSFLKRSFRYVPKFRRFLAPLELSVILEMPYWTKRCPNPSQITRDNLDQAILELSLHDKETFDKYSEVMLVSGREKLFYCPSVQDQRTLVEVTFVRDEHW